MRRHLVFVALLLSLILGPSILRAQSTAALGNVLYFAATDPAHGTELWRSDGTVAGTRRVIDLRPGPAGSDPIDLTVFQGRLYFAADDGVRGREIWSTDGTAPGTRLLKDVCPGSCTWLAPASGLVPSGDRLFFLLKEGWDRDYRLWSTDGTTGGTAEAASLGFSAYLLAPVANGKVLLSVTPTGFGGTDYFWAGDAHGTADLGFYRLDGLIPLGSAALFWKDSTLRRTDGTAVGTQLVQQSISAPSTPPLVVNGTAYFANPEGIWKTDGTPAGTVKLSDGYSDALFAASPCGPVFRTSEVFYRIREPEGQLEPLSQVLNLGAVVGPWSAGDRVFYVTEKTDESETPELWKVDPKTCKTRKVIALCGARDCAPGVPLPVQQPAGAGRIGFFVLQTAAGRLVLWRTNGTAAGTFRLGIVGRAPRQAG